MGKRILSITAACMVLISALCAISAPASAVDIGEQVYYSPIQIDSFMDDQGISFGLPSMQGVEESTFSGVYGYPFGGSIGRSGTTIGSFPTYQAHITGCDNFVSLRSDVLQVLQRNSYLKTFEVYFLNDIEDIDILSVDVSFRLWHPQKAYHEDGSSYWSFYWDTINLSVPVSDVSLRVPVGESIYNYLDREGPYSYFMISALEIDISFGRNSLNSASVGYSVQMTPADPSSNVLQWFSVRNLDANSFMNGSTVPNLLDWMLVSVESFLTFEFGPGLRIAGLVAVVITAGLLLWFAKFMK